jgi:Rrf2 family protein
LEQIFNKLKKSELVFSVKGPGGGYSLSRSPQNIKISEIVNGVEENIKATGCSNDPSKFCTGKNEKCITHHFLEDLESLIENYLDSVALSDIALNKDNSFLGLRE